MDANDLNQGQSVLYTVRLDQFEGPLDLLLHLIKKEEINILDIPIARITDQYLEYLKLMKILNLDVAGDYLLMASTLLHIKSKMLLPESSVEEEEPGEDPRAELVRRLLEYQRFKEVANDLEKRPLLERDVFTRPVSREEGEREEEKLEVNLFELLEAFRRVLERTKPETVHEVQLDPITVEQKIEEVLSLLQREKRSIAFHLLFPEPPSRRDIIPTFLALLELVRTKMIRIFQMAPFETIWISPI